MSSLVAECVTEEGVPLSVALDELAPDAASLAALAERWRALETRADPSFFCSWGWIGTWLAVLPRERRRLLATVTEGSRPLAFAMLVPGSRQLLRVIPRRVARLNDSAIVAERGATIEHNGLLAARGHEADPALWEALWRSLCRAGIGELWMPYVAASRFAVPPDVLCRREAATAAPFIDFAKTERGPRIAEALMSRNGREQLRRARKAYQTRGGLEVRRADSVEQAFDFLAGLEALHQATWQRRGRPGSFADPFFVAFHRRLIETRFAAGEIELLAVTAGAAEVGYLYNFRYRDRVYAYQSGFSYESDPRLKPGLVCHAAAIELAASDPTIRFYDFLAGDSRFKRGFANESETLLSVMLSRNNLFIKLENTVKNLLKSRGQASETAEMASAD